VERIGVQVSPDQLTQETRVGRVMPAEALQRLRRPLGMALGGIQRRQPLQEDDRGPRARAALVDPAGADRVPAVAKRVAGPDPGGDESWILARQRQDLPAAPG